MRKIGILGLVGVLSGSPSGLRRGRSLLYPQPPSGLRVQGSWGSRTPRIFPTARCSPWYTPCLFPGHVHGPISTSDYLSTVTSRTIRLGSSSPGAGHRGGDLLRVDLRDSEHSFYPSFSTVPLDGSTDWPVIPLDASIVSATLDLFVNSRVLRRHAIPASVDLVFFSPANRLTPDLYYQRRSIPYVDFFRRSVAFVPLT